ncbi:MAG TPA: TRAM domain-containing protein [Streptosporangiaceae bacterium]|nr:TRAM domain-containing protein [Streptosporangiaceae bacterium]
MTDQLAVSVTVGDIVDLSIGEVAHGGWCVARLGERDSPGLVVFVRHALPGERVRAVITDVTAKLARADATEVIAASPARVRPPCPYARPDGCGGCDWQHASLDAQRDLKAQVIGQQLRRIASLDRQVVVEPLPAAGTADGLGWRTRVTYAVDGNGKAGLRKHRSHEIVPITDCLIAHPLVRQADVTRKNWKGARAVDVAAAPHHGERAVLAAGRAGGQRRFLTRHAAGRDWRVAVTGFWQVHPAAAGVLAAAVLAALRPQPGETALDVFCGAGLFAGVLAEAVGPAGTVIAIEQDAAAVSDARYNLRDQPWARVRRGDAAGVLEGTGPAGAHLAVLDPPRAGAGRRLIDALCQDPALSRVAYVSCDPATLARDIAYLRERGWELTSLRAFDAFPMTHHVECLAVLAPRT